MSIRKAIYLTITLVEKLPYPLAGRREYRDEQTPGLVLRIGKSSKVYYFYSRDIQAQRERKIRLGTWREMTPAEARRKVRRLLEPTRMSTMPGDAIRETDELLTTKEAAALLKLSVDWFARERWQGTGPPYLKRGHAVRYVKRELLEWLGKGRH